MNDLATPSPKDLVQALRTASSRLLALAFTAVLSACGGGGDGQGADAATASPLTAVDGVKRALTVPAAGVLSAKRAPDMFGSAAALDNVDLNGDGKADLLWYNAVTGETIGWLMNGNNFIGGGLVLQDANIKVLGTGDFNGDGKTDLLWYNAATRQTVMWLMNGTAFVGGGTLPNNPDFSVVGTPDLNGDGKSDLLWLNPTTGHTYVWLMNGITTIEENTVLVHPQFRVVAMPDLNGDGKSDLVWHNAATGESVAWLMNGLSLIGGGPLLTHPNFKVIGAPDLNGDGRSDLVWYNAATGESVAWLMNGITLVGGGPLLTHPSFKVLGTPDLNGDGKADLLWYNAATGESVAWVMDGIVLVGGGPLLTHPTFKIASASDLNGDGKMDLQWYSPASGETIAWLMNGNALLGGGALLTDPNYKLASVPAGTPVVTARTVGGTVTGLTGSGLVLRNNGGGDLAIGGNGAFAFAATVANGGAYAVTIASQPGNPAQTCTVGNGSGVATANVTSVAVTCIAVQPSSYSVGGTVTGLSGLGLVLFSRCPADQFCNNGGKQLEILANGAFNFTGYASGEQYAVSVFVQPYSEPAQNCSVSGGTGTIAGNVTNIVVNCTTLPRYTLGGVISGLTGTGLVLQNSGGELLSADRNGLFTFATPVSSGFSYNVTVRNQPTANPGNPAQVCTVANGAGNATFNVTAVTVTCAVASRFNIGGTVTGMEGKGLVLQNNNGDNLAVSGNGSFTFATALVGGSSYNVTVLTQPNSPSQACTVGNGSGTVGAASIANVTVNCPATPKTTEIYTGKNVVKIKATESVEIPVTVVNGTGFTWSSPQLCALVQQGTGFIRLIGRTRPGGFCVENVTVSSGGVSKTITVNLYDPLTMHIGEGLVIKYVNTFSFQWWDSGSGGSFDAVFWHPISGQNDGWYPVGGYVQGNYGDITATKDVPMIVVRDFSAAQNLLADPIRYEGQWDTSGMDSDVAYGAVWKPICPAGYVSLGSVFGGGGFPLAGSVKCVAQRFTTRATRGASIYNDSDTGASGNLSVWKVGPPLQGVPDGKAAIPPGSVVGCPGPHDGSGCDPTSWNLLLVPMVVAQASDAGREPRLTGYAALTANELAGYGTRFSSSVRVPFTMIASEDPQCGTSACAGAAGRVDINVRTSPFYYISRQESYVDLNLYARNLTSRDQNLGPRNITVGWSTEDSKSFSQQVGLELGVEAKIYSAKLTVQLAWSQSSTVSKNGSQTETFGPYVIPPGEFLQVLGVSTTFKATSELGTVLPSTLGGTTTGTIYLSWPEAP